MGVVNHPVVEVDGGIVLDRRCYSSLGPEGQGAPPTDAVRELHELVGPRAGLSWPEATCTT